jgi:2-polyprenyl-6-methoxyphenol hydroxylase-like FAD-dependent oxidoreductase
MPEAGVVKAPVLVAGSGIGGLVTALALRHAGVPFRLFERARELRAIGAGLTVQPNAVLALRRTGLDRAVVDAGRVSRRGRLLRHDGRVLSDPDLGRVCRTVGAEAVGIHRATLQQLLLDALGADGPLCGREVVRYEERDTTVQVTFRDGSVEEGCALVGADGLRSAVRAQLLGAGEPVYAGYTSWRGVAPVDIGDVGSSETWGAGRRFGIVPIDGGRTYWFATLDAPAGGVGGQEALPGLFAGWHEPVEALLRATPADALLRTDIADRPVSAVWGRGRVTLLGDAAHPMTPNLGQGACQAIEDAVVLARSLSVAGDVVDGLRRYEAGRIPRANQVVVLARRLGQIGQWSHPWSRAARDALFAAMPAGLTERQLAASWRFD